MSGYQEKGYGYIVYFFDQEKEKLEVLLQYEGKKINEIKKENNNCYICSKSTKAYKKLDKYVMAVAKLYEEESKVEKIEKSTNNRRKKKIWFKNKKKKRD